MPAPQDFVSKPFDMAEVLATVGKFYDTGTATPRLVAAGRAQP